MKEELLRKLIDGAYSCACIHGFHDKDLSIRHLLMLVLTEVSEAVEADRNGLRANLYKFDKEFVKYAKIVEEDVRFKCAFEKFVKDNVEDELADVCIRIFDLCGTLGIEPIVPPSDDSAMKKFRELFGEDTFCERMYELCCILAEDSDGDKDLNDTDFVEDTLGSSLFFIICLCKDMGIDLERHIELKMRYNELRPANHGKRY